MPTTHQAAGVFQISSSCELPPSQRYDNWLQTNLEGLSAVTPNPSQARDFRGHILALTSATSALYDAHLDPFEARRSARHIDSDDGKLALLYVRQGTVQVGYQDGITAQAKSGQFLLYDSELPSTIRLDRSRFVQVTLPRSRIPALTPRAARSNDFVRAMDKCPLSRMLTLQLGNFHRLLPSMDATLYPSLLQATEAMALTVMQAAGINQGTPQGLSGWYAMATQFIEQHLSDPRLNADFIARALGCGRSTLYKAFSEQGRPIATYIREARLEKLARLLQAREHHLPLADLAFQCGLHDSSNLSRLFRARFDMSPSEFRNLYR